MKIIVKKAYGTGGSMLHETREDAAAACVFDFLPINLATEAKKEIAKNIVKKRHDMINLLQSVDEPDEAEG